MKPETQPNAAAPAAKKPKAEKRPPASPAEGHEEAVRHMAYLLYVERGHVEGYEIEDWLRAEALVSQQAAARAPAAPEAPEAPKAAAKRAPVPAAAKKPAAPVAKRAPAKPRSE